MSPSIPTQTDRVGKAFLLACVVFVTFAGHCDKHKHSDPLVQLEEMRQRSVTEDLAFKGELPFDWLMANAPKPNSPPSEDELAQFLEMFKQTTAPKIVEAELVKGATRVVELKLDGPSQLAGSAEWIGSTDALKVTISRDGSTLVTGTAFKIDNKRGGCILNVQTPVGGRASIAVTNTTKKKVKVRILLLATAL